MSDESLKARLKGGEIVPVASMKNEALARVERAMPSVTDLVRGSGVPLDRFKRMAMNVMLDNGGALLKCEGVSVVRSIIKAAEFGMEPGNGVAIVAYGSKAQLVFEAKGLIKLAMDSGMILNFADPEVVYEGEYRWGHNQNGPWFEYVPLNDTRDAKPIGVLFGVKLKSGDWKYVFTDLDRIKLAQSKSAFNKAKYDPGPSGEWLNFWKKTGVINTFKYIPKSPKFQEALAASSGAEPDAEFDTVTGEVIDPGYREDQE